MKIIAARYEDWKFFRPGIGADRHLYVFGRTENSAQAAQHLELAGVIDDFAAGTTWQGLPVIHGDDVPGDAIVISTILHRAPGSLARFATLKNQPRVIHYCDFVRNGAPPLERNLETQRCFFGSQPAFQDLYDRLDVESQKIFDDIMLFRLTGDAAFMTGYGMREHEQYFDLDLKLPDAPVFLDGGAFQGETTENFCTRFPHYGGAHVFEPVEAAMEKAKDTLKDRHDMQFHGCALGDRPETVRFDVHGGTSSRVIEHGGEEISIARADDKITGPVHLIKYDLEGYEPRAVRGAVRLIGGYHPTLAICVYHKTADFIDVLREVFAVRQDYRLALRHYTQGWNETVLYFIPER